METLPVLRYQAAGGVVIDAAGRVLLIERSIDGRHEVRLPKGHIDPGETAAAAARREVCEETGYCDLQLLADLGWREVTFERANGDQVVRQERFYLMQLASQRHQPPGFVSEAEALFRNRWVSGFAEARRLLTFEGEQDAVRRAEIANHRIR